MVQPSMLRRLWRAWKRGLGVGYWLALAMSINFFSLGMQFAHQDNWFTYTALIVWIVLLLFFPLSVGAKREDPTSVREDTAARLSPDVDAILAHFGLKWEESPIYQVDKLLKEKRQPEASRLYRSATGVTWDETEKAFANWPTPMLEGKLKLIRERLHQTSVVREVACTN